MGWVVSDRTLSELWGADLPHNDVCEQAVLGGLIWQSKSGLAALLKQLHAEMFYDRWHRGLYEWLRDSQNERWRWIGSGREFMRRLESQGRALAAEWEKPAAGYHLGRLMTQEYSTVADLPACVRTLRKMMLIRQRIVAAEKELRAAWEAAESHTLTERGI